METSLMQTKRTQKEKRTRLNEIEDDLDQTEFLFNQSRDKQFREGINKLRYLLIVEQHAITNPKFDF